MRSTLISSARSKLLGNIVEARSLYPLSLRERVGEWGFEYDCHSITKAFLQGTGDKVIVEASPRDRIWGIGMGASNPDASNPAKWRGLNLLGFALMEVRSIGNNELAFSKQY